MLGRGIYLHRRHSEEGDPDIPVTGVLDSLRFAAQLQAGSPTGDPNRIGRGLAKGVEIEPRWVGGRECPHVPRDDGSDREHDPPAHSIENSMDLTNAKEITSGSPCGQEPHTRSISLVHNKKKTEHPNSTSYCKQFFPENEFQNQQEQASPSTWVHRKTRTLNLGKQFVHG